jgi:hypothetical protein
MDASAYRTVRAVAAVVLLAAAPSALVASAGAASAATRVVPHAGYYTGLGFDACATPSEAAMSAWRASPFRAVAVYVGGVNRACSQPNLTAGWVSTELAAGWGIVPTYVGLQAPGNSCGCAAIVPSEATSEGTAAASDAVTQMRAIGVDSGPVYYDMEGYTTGGSATSAVLTFLAAWTVQLHAEGYLSGVYSSSGSGITDLVSKYGSGYTEPDDIWIADWNGQQSTGDPAVPAGDWADHQRLHQYEGGHDDDYGGVTINIDGDYLDGAVVLAGGSAPGAPSGVTAVAGNRSALVSWKAPATGTVTSYEITSTPGKHLTVVPASVTSTVVAGLSDGVAYSFRVVAESAAGASPPSAPSAAVTATKSTAVPGQPRTVRASGSGGTATVTWAPPLSSGSAAITAYYVTSVPGGITVSVPASARSAGVGGLAGGTTYTFWVTALSARGPGAPSARSNGVTG